jgi:hypothetical protein
MPIAFRSKRVIAAVVIAACVAAWLVADWLIVTEAECVEQVMDRLFAAAERADVEGMIAEVASDYRQEEGDRDTLQGYARRYFAVCGPTRVSVYHSRIKVEGQVATADLRLFARVQRETPWGRRAVGSRWRLAFVRYGRRWYVDRIAPVEIGSTPFESLKDLMRHVP